MSRPWFLHRRITFAFGLTTLLLSLGLSVPFGWIVYGTIRIEIDGLAHEELDEVRAYFFDREPSVAEFRELADDASREHADTPLAWRIWSPANGQIWGEFGPPALLERLPRKPGPGHGIRAPSAATRIGTAELDGGQAVVLLLDATSHWERFTRFLWSVLAFVLLATATATAAGHRLARRVSRLLAQVAESAGTEDSADTWIPPSAAPEEVRAVVMALQDTLRRIRDESENARLLVSGLAHELRSPLQNLMGETQVALLNERDAGEYKRVLESQLEDLGELSRVVDNLVTLSSLDEALRRHSVERFDFGEEARLRLTRERQLARRRGISIDLVTDGPLVIDGDRESLLLALRNVVTNAIEWSPPDGMVHVRIGSTPEGLEILVDDSGPGVPEEQRENLFRPFRRGPAARGRRVGFGLGLALTHSAVRTHGGRIEVGQSPSGGARFRITLPRAGR